MGHGRRHEEHAQGSRSNASVQSQPPVNASWQGFVQKLLLETAWELSIHSSPQISERLAWAYLFLDIFPGSCKA